MTLDTPGRVAPLTVFIPLRDGIHVAADIFLPAAGAASPAIVEITPYRRGSALSYWNNHAFWTDRGFALVIVDTRGCGDSEGEFVFFRQEGQDGYDIVEWLGGQPWCSGAVGLTGGSYSGTNQWLIAREHPPHLRAINPNSTVARFMSDLCYIGGALHLGWTMTWPMLVTAPDSERSVDWSEVLAHRPLRTADIGQGAINPLHREILDHPTHDAFWRELELSDEDMRRIDLPILALSGWYDTTLSGTLRYFEQRVRTCPDAPDHHLIVGPWDHDTARRGGLVRDGSVAKRTYGALTIPEAANLAGQDIVARFFDAHLRHGPQFKAPAAKVFVPGADIWLESDTFPPHGLGEIQLYLSDRDGDADGRLTEAPPASVGSASFTHHPARPLSSMLGGQPLSGGPLDIRELVDAGEGLVYDSGALEASFIVLGDVRAELWIVSDAPDCDFVLRLIDRHPDGKAINLGPTGGGVSRARYRLGYDREVLLVPGEPTRLVVDLLEIAHQFAVGHRIQLQLVGSAYPFISVNPGTGKPIATDTEAGMSITQTVLHGGAHGSSIILPIFNSVPSLRVDPK